VIGIAIADYLTEYWFLFAITDVRNPHIDSRLLAGRCFAVVTYEIELF